MNTPGFRSMTAALVTCLVLGCSGDQERLAGSGSVTTNGFTGTITRDGMPTEGIRVSLFEAGRDPIRDSARAVPRQVTDRNGEYGFEKVAAGGYNLIAYHPSEGTVAHITGAFLTTAHSMVRLPDAPLRSTGRIRVRLPEDAREAGAYLYLPGTDIFMILDSAAARNGEITLEKVPPSSYGFLLYRANASDTARNILTRPLEVSPEGTGTVNPFNKWKRAFKVSINTSSTGANVADDLSGFPLLVRLHAGNFDFSLSNPDGSDLRVTKSDSATPLPFEIETWDPVGKTAALWIRVDTLRGNSATQFLCLFAGNKTAAANQGTGRVFETASGFKAVWHLGESPAPEGGLDAIMSDRTGNAFHGVPSTGMTADGSVQGVIGRGLLLDGKDDFVELPASNLFLPDSGQPLTLSAWISPSAIQTSGDSIRHRLVSFKTDSLGLSSLAWGVSSNHKMSHYNRSPDSVFYWAATVLQDTVYHVALTYEGGTFKGYIDGRLDYSGAGPIPASSGIHPAYLGAHLPGKLAFQGLMDEFRIENAARSAGWIRMSFETQKPGSASVKVE